MEKANLIPTKHEFIEELTEEDVIQIQSRSISGPPLADSDIADIK